MTIRDEDLKPFKPLPRQKTDALTYAVRFGCGAMVGVVISVMLLGAVARMWYRRYFRESIGES